MGISGVGFIGRERELKQCAQFLDTRRSGTLGLLLIAGGQGIGKTALLAAVVSQLGEGVDLVTIGADEGRLGIAFGVFDGALDAMPPPGADPEAIRDAIVDAFEERAVQRPLVIAIDDTQWLDDASLRTMQLASLRLRDLPVAIIATIRGGLDHPAAIALTPDQTPRSVESIRLDPLTPLEVEELVRMRCGDHFENALGSAQQAAGNPLLVEELVDAAIGRVAAKAASPAPNDERAIDAALHEAARHRLERLPLALSELLQQLAILGSTFDAADALAVSAAPRDQTLARLQALLDLGLVGEADGHGLRFHHPSTYKAAYEAQPKALRAEHHRAAAQALARTGRPAGAVANQLDAASDALGPDDTALLLDTGQAVVKSHPELGIRLLEKGLTLRPTSELRERLAIALLDALLVANRPQDVYVGARNELEHPASDDHRFDVMRRRYAALGLLGQHSERRLLLEHALTQPHVGARERAWSQFYLLETCWVLGEGVPEELTQKTLADARALGDGSLLARSLGPLAWSAMTTGDVVRCVEYAREARGVLTRSDVWVDGVGTYVGTALATADLFDEVRKVHADTYDTERRLGIVSNVVAHHIGRASADYAQGKLSDGRAEIGAAFQAIAEGGAALVTPVFGHGYGALLAAQAGATEEFEHHVDRANALLAEGHPPFGVNYLALARVYQGLATGDVEEPFAILRLAWEGVAARGFSRPWREALPTLTRLSMSAGRVDDALSYANTATTGAERAPSILSAVATAARCQGIVERDAAKVARAAEDLLRSGRITEAGCAFEDATAVALSNADPKSADTYLERARDVFNSIGADGGINRLEHLTNDRPPSRRSARPTSGWASVTPSELAVVELVAAGHSNPKVAAELHLSRYTVESHLKRVYMKLGIASRAALATAYANRP